VTRRRIRYGLSRELWLVEIGVLVNMLGYGAVLPFEIIYLHDGRGFSLRVAGLAVAMLTAVAALTAGPAGALIDRRGARRTAAGAGVALAAGYAGLALAHTPAEAFAAAAMAGAGNGALGPAQTTLLTSLAPPPLRHRASAVSRVAVNAGIGLGGLLGGVVAAHGLPGFVALLVLNACTYLVYVALLLVVVPADPPPARPGAGYGTVARDATFVRLAATNVALIAVGWGVLAYVVAPYAGAGLHIGTRSIGLLMLANAATVVIAQVPVTRLAEGRRRTSMLALGAGVWAAACVLATLAGDAGRWAEPVLAASAVAFAVGECFHSSALTPLVAELAPPELRGRYMAAIGLSWWTGLALAPAAGATVLAVSPAAALLGAGALAAAAGLSARLLDGSLPEAARLTPRPARTRAEEAERPGRPTPRRPTPPPVCRRRGAV
jgi:MFS family permease